MNIDKLTLLGGSEVAIPSLGANLHQPIIREISIIGEKDWYRFLSYFKINKEIVLQCNADKLTESGKSKIESMSNFEIFMQMINGSERKFEIWCGVNIVLSILFPQYNFELKDDTIMGISNDKKGFIILNNENFQDLVDVINAVFCLQEIKSVTEYNPIDEKAKAIADKLKARKQKLKTIKKDEVTDQYILCNYISSIGIGTNSLNILDAVNLTVYQLFDQIKRFGLREQSEQALRAILAGAKDIEMVDWLQSL